MTGCAANGVTVANDVDSAGTVCAAFAVATPCQGAAFTVMTSDSARELLCASDPVIAAVAELQFSLGEGPALEVFTTGLPALIADLASPRPGARWPAFTAEVAALQVGGLFAFPMHLGAVTLGVCEVYRREPGPLSVSDLGAVLRALDTATLALLSLRAGDGIDGPHDGGGEGLGRRQVHQATGMLIAQLGIDAEQAFARLRAHAYAEGKDVQMIAADIVRRRLRLEPDPT